MRDGTGKEEARGFQDNGLMNGSVCSYSLQEPAAGAADSWCMPSAPVKGPSWWTQPGSCRVITYSSDVARQMTIPPPGPVLVGTRSD